MKILVTGANGFIAKNLIVELRNQGHTNIFEFNATTDPSLLGTYCKKTEFVYHLAGVNRPKNQSEFMKTNFGFTSHLLKTLKKYNNTCPVMMASSIQAIKDTPYGRSKKAGEDLMFAYAKETGAKVLVYRFPNVFGKWCKPNYNSVIATFCHCISRDLPIKISDPDVVMALVYIDDLIAELVNALQGNESYNGVFCEVQVVYTTELTRIVDLLYSFRSDREELTIPNMADEFTKKLYSTYLTYLPEDQFNYLLKINADSRGSFTELIKSPDRGQVSVNISKPGVIKGNHWHHSKNERFLVVSGRGVIRLRDIYSEEVFEYYISANKLEVVDIPPGYTHSIENLGAIDMVTIMWANECFDPDNPDTYYMEV